MVCERETNANKNTMQQPEYKFTLISKFLPWESELCTQWPCLCLRSAAARKIQLKVVTCTIKDTVCSEIPLTGAWTDKDRNCCQQVALFHGTVKDLTDFRSVDQICDTWWIIATLAAPLWHRQRAEIDGLLCAIWLWTISIFTVLGGPIKWKLHGLEEWRGILATICLVSKMMNGAPKNELSFDTHTMHRYMSTCVYCLRQRHAWHWGFVRQPVSIWLHPPLLKIAGSCLSRHIQAHWKHPSEYVKV